MTLLSIFFSIFKSIFKTTLNVIMTGEYILINVLTAVVWEGEENKVRIRKYKFYNDYSNRYA